MAAEAAVKPQLKKGYLLLKYREVINLLKGMRQISSIAIKMGAAQRNKMH